jgi:hypothetical protein
VLSFAALNAAHAAWKSAFACRSVAARLSVRTRKRAGPITVIDQNQRLSGRLASQNLEWHYSECESRGTVPEQLYFAGADRD